MRHKLFNFSTDGLKTYMRERWAHHGPTIEPSLTVVTRERLQKHRVELSWVIPVNPDFISPSSIYGFTSNVSLSMVGLSVKQKLTEDRAVSRRQLKLFFDLYFNNICFVPRGLLRPDKLKRQVTGVSCFIGTAVQCHKKRCRLERRSCTCTRSGTHSQCNHLFS